MAKVLLNLCLDTQESNVKVVPAGQGGAPIPPPYWFTVYWSMEGDPVLTKGDFLVLDGTGPCRVYAWDSEPTEIPSPTGSGSQDPSIRVRVEGAAALISCGPDDPWPQT